jgi:hypothetical protein
MAQPGEGGPEIAALGSLKANAKRFGTKVGIDTNVRTGRIEANMTVMATVGSDTYREVVKLSAMFTERKGDKQSSTAKR